jgi:hypothetical protein
VAAEFAATLRKRLPSASVTAADQRSTTSTNAHSPASFLAAAAALNAKDDALRDAHRESPDTPDGPGRSSRWPAPVDFDQYTRLGIQRDVHPADVPKHRLENLGHVHGLTL